MKVKLQKLSAGVTQTDDGIELEDLGIFKPFDPLLIKIETKQMSLDTLISRIKADEISLSPDFQRDEVWGLAQKSQLIESLLIKIPLPAFYLDATNDERWLVVDGLQRLSAIRDFVLNGSLKLDELEFLKNFHGLGYKDLPKRYQRRINETQVTVYQIEEGTPPELKFNIFKRINTGGMPLSSQEIRHALNQGQATSFLKDMIDNEAFNTATRGMADRRMAARECALRFVAFKLTPPERYLPNTNFDTFLSEAMQTINRMSTQELDSLKAEFVRALTWAWKIFGLTAFRKPNAPFNKALFEVYVVVLSYQSDKQLALMERDREKLIRLVAELIEKDEKFSNAISQGTSSVNKVRYRFTKFNEVVSGDSYA